MYVLACDPGTTKSAWVVIDELLRPVAWAWEENERVLSRLDHGNWYADSLWFGGDEHDFVIEDMTHYGKNISVGKDVFETVRWSGRFDYMRTARFISRPEVKLHICGSPRAKDANIRQAVIDRYGGQEVAIGGVKCFTCKGKGWVGRGRPTCTGMCEGTGWQVPPGPLYEFSRAGMGSHGWSALALGLTHVGSTT